MRMLVLDIGVGTTDVMLIDSDKNAENCTKAVIPSPIRQYAAAVRRATGARRDLFILGDTIGGGEFSSALKKHVAAGLKVTMTEKAAFSVRNDLDEVRERGIAVVEGNAPPDGFVGDVLWLQEVRLREIVRFFSGAGESGGIDFVGVAVQDHGVSPKGVSNRTTRIERFRQIISKDRRLESLCFEEGKIPEDFLRLRCAASRARKEMQDTSVFVMDTSPAAALGCLEDPGVDESGCVLTVNAGNGHTLAALLRDGEVLGAMEAHTRAFDPKKLGKFLKGFLDSTLSNEDVHNDGGHGLFRLEDRLPEPDQILVTGPNRMLMEGSGMEFRYATPAGDVMMTGPIGLNRAIRYSMESS